MRWTEEDYTRFQERAKPTKRTDTLQSVIEDHGFIPAESVEQRAVACYLDSLGVLWCHVPNEGKRKKSTGGFLVGQGLKKGCPDVLIFDSPPASPAVRGVAIEMKRKRGGKVSPEQQEWLDRLNGLGWITFVCQGANDALKVLKGLGWK